MIILKKLSQLDTAIKKAKKLNPEVTIIEIGLYHVVGAKGDLYEVTMRLDGEAQRLIYCSCEEKHPTKENTICYHAGACIGLHMILALGKVQYVGMLDKNTRWIRFKDED